ncbi:hypothetical protein E2320_009502 [Naja naja]|nr:hypothetical protein E2320_009502 [Naja naja]
MSRFLSLMFSFLSAMADHYTYRVGKKVAGSSRTSAERESRKAELKVHAAYEQSNLGNAMNDKTESKRKGRPKTENQALKDIPVEKAVALQHPENGEHAAVSQGIRALKTTAAGGGEGAATPLGQTPGTRSSKHQASRQAFKQEEDPERMKHTTPEEQWQRIINEKGEVACPTCGMITRKTVLGLKKHMEVCQKDWTKRRMKDDLVPETKQLNYTRPGLPKLNPRLLEAWKNEVKEKGHINCPNDCCAAIYCSVSGLKAHLANCNKNWFHTSTDSLKKKKSKEPSTPSNEEQKTSPDGKKRGRKPKERPSEFFPKDTESLLGNINHKKATSPWPVANCILDEKERGNKPFHAPKFGASKMPEK